MATELEPGDDLIQRAVATAGNDQVRIAGTGAREIHRVAALLRDIDGRKPAGTVKDGDDLRQETPGLAGTGVGVDQQKEFFQFIIHNSQFIIRD